MTTIRNSLSFLKNHSGKTVYTIRSGLLTPNAYYTPALAAEHSLSSDSEEEIDPVNSTGDQLAREIQKLWSITKEQVQERDPLEIDTDHMLFELLVAQCMIEAREYKVFSTIEEYEAITERQNQLKYEIEAVEAKLQVNKKIQEACSHLPSSLESDEVDEAVDSLTVILRGLYSQLAETIFTLLHHTVGILCSGIQAIEAQNAYGYELQLDTVRAMLQSMLNEDNPNITTCQLLDILELQINSQQKQTINTQSYQERVEKDLQEEYNELFDLQTTVSDLEFQTNLIQSQVDWLQVRQDTLKSEIETYRSKVFDLRSQKQEIINCKLSMQKAFSEKEELWINASSNLEAKREGVLKEVHRLAVLTQEFQADQTSYEKRIKQLTHHAKRLELELMDKGFYEETLTTATLRQEFKEITEDIQTSHHLELETILAEKKRLENQIRDAKHERALIDYNRVNQGVQTLFRP